MKMAIISTMLFLFFRVAIADAKDNVIIKYKKYDEIDLGNLEIKGKLLAPGDLSVQERDRVKFSRKLYLRDDYLKEQIKEVYYLR
ncbi:hypothetical protein HBN50_09910 [Halobacteriovorax sp. GB3]|uniref:hypothetical protein n=1 Tax=Halobacteriovorax sp. GB3 TaxID=2719615 RepID=UPI00235E9479|nr:hypothetical protein [Halobacteriovorax sp. GB3]MDD0853414.1 hypothetical protein [Halobacteriovorax sp. GB3]